MYRNLPSVLAVDLTELEAEFAMGETVVAETIMALAGRSPLAGSTGAQQGGSRVPG